MCIIQAAANWVTFTTLGGSKAEHRSRIRPGGLSGERSRRQGYVRTGRDGWTYLRAHEAQPTWKSTPNSGFNSPSFAAFHFRFCPLSVFFLRSWWRAPLRNPAREGRLWVWRTNHFSAANYTCSHWISNAIASLFCGLKIIELPKIRSQKDQMLCVEKNLWCWAFFDIYYAKSL